MTRKNNLELLQMLATMQTKINEFNNNVKDLQSQLATAQNLNSKNFSELADAMKINHLEIMNLIQENQKNNTAANDALKFQLANFESAQNEKIAALENSVQTVSENILKSVEESEKNNTAANDALKFQLANFESAQNEKIAALENSVQTVSENILKSVEESEKNNTATNKSLSEIQTDLSVVEELLKLTSANQIMNHLEAVGKSTAPRQTGSSIAAIRGYKE